MPVVLEILTRAFIISYNSGLQDLLGCERPARTHDDIRPRIWMDLVRNQVGEVESCSTLRICYLS
jgi:hypothetical protein